jgi:pilus assembly protein CpaF
MIKKTLFGNKGVEKASKISQDKKEVSPQSETPLDTPQLLPALERFRMEVHGVLMKRIDLKSAINLSRQQLRRQVEEFVVEYANHHKSQLNEREQFQISTEIVNDMVGLGPLEPLLADDAITDIMVNGPQQTYVERKGKLILTKVKFRDQSHLVQVAQRIAVQIGRRVDESSPMVDARLADGSRVNIVLPPITLDGASISIRKFSKTSINFDGMIKNKTIDPRLAHLLQIASTCRLNVLVSGGTGSGKTTLLNALSSMIDPNERIVTVEDAAELKLQQPHVVRLESRPANIEGEGQITIRDLVRNALRMRPERIIIGEVRGGECLDMLQAMNTGHDGSMATIHANSAIEALGRLENLVSMSGVTLPSHVIRQQIVNAVDLIVQTERMRDGVRRIKEVSEVVGAKDGEIQTHNLFTYEFEGETETGQLIGSFKSSKEKPHFYERARYYGLHNQLLECLKDPTPV